MHYLEEQVSTETDEPAYNGRREFNVRGINRFGADLRVSSQDGRVPIFDVKPASGVHGPNVCDPIRGLD